ncbi:AMP-dependent synthetase/ligase [Streptomyces sp. XM83C]|uniref:AMP-dependent synthetase/ligase n=1 Tax=Streptomyces thermocoprophilus TaxID=78356 RepID=A0ABV5VLU7_9ACTN|nr:AMP-dependent synthetase/ligase [Streptomyces sp. XM83C]MCK1821710.1 AMP-dependent synthetase/ligase [Streptomyces sp. XM83C]
MRDFALAPPAVSPLTGGLADHIFEAADQDPTLPMLARRDPVTGAWQEVTAVEVRDQVSDLAKGLVSAGVSPGHRVALMARTRYEWTVLCHALWAVGAEVVPIHPTSSREQVAHILRDSGCVGVAVEDEQSVMTVGSVCASLPRLRHVWQLDAGALQDLVERGASIPLTTVDSLRRIVLPDSTAVVAYTSGTGGRPLGCALSHRGLASNCDTLLAGWRHTVVPPGGQGSVLAFLPFSHVYGLMVQNLCIRGGLLLGHQPDPSAEPLAEALRSFRPTYVCAVPSFFEKLYKRFLRTAQESGRGPLFERAARTAREFALATERQRLGRGAGPGLELRVQHALYERTVYRQMRAELGGRVMRGTSGGSPLGRDLALFFEGIGLYVNDGYGLTESSGGITAQPPGREKSGTVGRPLPGVEVRVAEDGEILVSGPTVFQGYVGQEAATRAVLHGGWLATGDLGRLDTEGYLSITGRKKDVIVTSAGNSVAPAPLEQRLRMHPLIHEAVVVGDDRPCVGALITLDPEFLAFWRGGLGLQGDAPMREDREEIALRDEIARAVAAVNSTVSRAESIRVFRILPHTFDHVHELLTPSLKVRRDAVVQHYAADIDAMYEARTRSTPTFPQAEILAWDDADDVFR